MCCQALGFLPGSKELFHSHLAGESIGSLPWYAYIAWIGKRWVPNPMYPPEKATFNAKSISKNATRLNLKPTLCKEPIHLM